MAAIVNTRDVLLQAALNRHAGVLLSGDGITLSAGGFIRAGQSAYNTGSGFWLGYTAATYKFSIGNSAGARLTWDGSALSLGGNADIDISGGAKISGSKTAVNFNGFVGAVVANDSLDADWGVIGVSDNAGGGGVGGYSGSATGFGGKFINLSGGVALAVEGPMTIDNSTKVVNLNADLLDGLSSAAFALAAGGVPAGGTTNQVLAKASNTNYDTAWVDQSGGGGGGDLIESQVFA